jgi:hypothetical protein
MVSEAVEEPLTLIESDFETDAEGEAESVTTTVKPKGPEELGVPEIVALLALKLRPGVKAPAVMLQL